MNRIGRLCKIGKKHLDKNFLHIKPIYLNNSRNLVNKLTFYNSNNNNN